MIPDYAWKAVVKAYTAYSDSSVPARHRSYGRRNGTAYVVVLCDRNRRFLALYRYDEYEVRRTKRLIMVRQ